MKVGNIVDPASAPFALRHCMSSRKSNISVNNLSSNPLSDDSSALTCWSDTGYISAGLWNLILGDYKMNLEVALAPTNQERINGVIDNEVEEILEMPSDFKMNLKDRESISKSELNIPGNIRPKLEKIPLLAGVVCLAVNNSLSSTNDSSFETK